MKNLVLISLFLLCNLAIFSQSKGDSIRYTVTNVGYIDVSKKLELQSGDYKPQQSNKMVFQQKGLNTSSTSSRDTYVRLIIETIVGSIGDYEKLYSKVDMSVSEMKEISESYKQALIQSFRGTGLKLLSWHGVSVEKINGQNCLKCSYLRQLNDNFPVEVEMYFFQNNDRKHTVTISYRQSEKTIWLPVLMKCLNSFKITNIK